MLQTEYIPQDEILIVDDDDLQRELMRTALEDLGFNIHEAANGAEALDVFRKHCPMLVVMDIHMPVVDGYKACEGMKQSPGGENAAVILVTGMEDLASVERAYDVGAIEFIAKPLDWLTFRMRVKYIIRLQQAYLRIQKSREKLARAQRAAGMGSWELDTQSACLTLSSESLDLLGLEPGAPTFTLDAIYKVVNRRDRRALLKAYSQLRRRNEPMDLDLCLDLGDDGMLTMHVHGETVPSDTDHQAIISGTIHDVTERRKAEDRILEAAAMKNQFLANMSHELRTPINGVMGMAELLSDTKLDEEQAMWTTYIVESAEHLLVVINDVLDFAKIEAGQVRIQPSSFSLRQSVNGTAKVVEAMVQAKGLSMSIEVEASLPESLVGDMVRIKQVLLNLVGNAIKFTKEGEISVDISEVRREGGRSHVRFAVRDTGIGIPQDKQDMIFEKFTQVDGSSTREHPGTGLGLAITQELVELMQGVIGLQSQEGEGTEIWFILPLGLDIGTVEDLPTNSPESAQPSVDASLLRVLLVEDNPVNQVFERRVLEQLNFIVDLANNGEQALAMVQKEAYDIIFMDCQMPIMDGYEATRRIRKLGPPFEYVPIIALTAHALEGDREKCLAAGMDDFIAKPVVGDRLVQSIRKWAVTKEPTVLL